MTARMFTSPLFLGFDHLEQMIERASKTSSDGYPPYNIEQTGPSARQFQRAFVLAEGIEVKGAWLDNGLLHVDLARPQPEVRVRTIQINKPAPAKPVVDATYEAAQDTSERD